MTLNLQIRNVAYLKESINEARDMLHRIWAEIDDRLDVCRATHGTHQSVKLF